MENLIRNNLNSQVDDDYTICRKMLENNPHLSRDNRDLDVECAPLKAEPENNGLDLVQLDDILALVAQNSLNLLQDYTKIDDDYTICRKMLENNPHLSRDNRDLDVECAPLKAEPENNGLDLVQLDDILALVAQNSLNLLHKNQSSDN